MSRVGGGVHRRCSSDLIQSSEMYCMEEFHVLAVDDNFVDRKIIERLLKISSCKDEENDTAGCCNGLKVHLIITDYSMPGMTGYELLNKIKESSKFREVPVVIMSSENILTRIHRCLEEGAEEYLLKPVKLADVKRLKDLIISGQLSRVKETSTSTNPILHELHGHSAVSPSSPSTKDINPVILSYQCSSPKTACISKRSRLRCRSSKYHSGLSQH
ncbi:hypothetical protein KSS87_007950 [Heliosperma pusillum]|nr:hypothetical protein KSS87_007950 [Heliosperma pusillum]